MKIEHTFHRTGKIVSGRLRMVLLNGFEKENSVMSHRDDDFFISNEEDKFKITDKGLHISTSTTVNKIIYHTFFSKQDAKNWINNLKKFEFELNYHNMKNGVIIYRNESLREEFFEKE